MPTVAHIEGHVTGIGIREGAANRPRILESTYQRAAEGLAQSMGHDQAQAQAVGVNMNGIASALPAGTRAAVPLNMLYEHAASLPANATAEQHLAAAHAITTLVRPAEHYRHIR